MDFESRTSCEIPAEVTAAGYSQVNLMGLVACQAAYETGEEWLKELKIYLEGNLDYVRTF